MNIGVDATNITSGGGLTHLKAFLDDAIVSSRYRRVVVWASEATILKLPRASGGIEYRTNSWLNKSIVQRILWTTFFLHKEMSGLDVLFVPGGLYLGPFQPYITMCHNMLPFDKAEVRRYGLSKERLRLQLLYWLQLATFRRAEGVIFLSNYAKAVIERLTPDSKVRCAVIPHGVSEGFRGEACLKRPVKGGARFLYVSTLAPYKNHAHLIHALSRLNAQGLIVELDIVGSGSTREQALLLQEIKRYKAEGFVHFHGHVQHDKLPAFYQQCDAVIYASGCENFPNILVEAMASGKPILSSNSGPMPEILEDSAAYFDPINVDSIVHSITSFLEMPPEKQYEMSVSSSRLALKYRWPPTLRSTYEFISQDQGEKPSADLEAKQIR